VLDSFSSNEIVVQNRSTYITQSMLGRRFQVYNGIRWFQLEIVPEMVGHCLGEFAPTRKHPIPKKKKSIKK
jgi:ribosomal protein S19